MEIETYKWDYIYEEWNDTYANGTCTSAVDKLKKLGKQGWEVCGSGRYRGSRGFILKRPCGKVRIVTRDQAQNNGYENER